MPVLDERNGRWRKFSTKTDDLEKAKDFAKTELQVRRRQLENNIEIDAKRFSFVDVRDVLLLGRKDATDVQPDLTVKMSSTKSGHH